MGEANLKKRRFLKTNHEELLYYFKSKILKFENSILKILVDFECKSNEKKKYIIF